MLANMMRLYTLDLHKSAYLTSLIASSKFTLYTVRVLGQRHTIHTSGRDSAANSASVHLDWLSVSPPCRLPPIWSHERLRDDSKYAARVAGLGEREIQRTSCIALSCRYQPSLASSKCPLLACAALISSSKSHLWVKLSRFQQLELNANSSGHP